MKGAVRCLLITCWGDPTDREGSAFWARHGGTSRAETVGGRMGLGVVTCRKWHWTPVDAVRPIPVCAVQSHVKNPEVNKFGVEICTYSPIYFFNHLLDASSGFDHSDPRRSPIPDSKLNLRAARILCILLESLGRHPFHNGVTKEGLPDCL